MSELSAEEIAKREKDSTIPFVDLRDGARGVLTWAQMDGDDLADAAIELIGEATRIAQHLDEDSRIIYTVIIGRKASQYTDKLIHHGADVVYVIEDERLTDYLTLPFTNAMVSAIREIKPEIALMSASTLGRDLAPRIAGILDLGLSADCTSFEVGYYVNRRKTRNLKKHSRWCVHHLESPNWQLLLAHGVTHRWPLQDQAYSSHSQSTPPVLVR